MLKDNITFRKESGAEFRKLDYNTIESNLAFMKGKILTVIDAVVPDEKQNKATKDLIHSIVGNTSNKFWQYTIGKKDIFPESNQSKSEVKKD